MSTKQYIRKCPDCSVDIIHNGKYNHSEAIRKNRKCRKCSQKGRKLSDHTKLLISQNNGQKGLPAQNRGLPYHWLLTRLIGQAKRRGIGAEITYEQFLSFVNQPCEYCGGEIIQSPYHSSKTKKHGWCLDRKDNDGPYSVDNCVSCCFSCNRLKGNFYNYSEMKQIGVVIQKIMEHKYEI